MKRVVAFLRDLYANNNTEWFHAHKAEYEQAKSVFNDFAQKLLVETASFDPSVAGLELKDCTYRINRDIRFSADKSPYKTHFCIFIAPGGKKSGYAGYYFHLSLGGDSYPDQNLVAIGHYCYDKKVVEIVREDLEEDGSSFDAFVQEGRRVGLELDREDSLKKVPKAFQSSQYADYARLKSYLLSTSLREEDVFSDDLLDRLLTLFKSSKPFVDYLNRIISFAKEEG